MGAEDHAAARVVRCAARALAGTAGALLAVRLAPPPRTSPRVLVSAVPVRRPASWATTAWCRTAVLTGAANSASGSSTVPASAPVLV